jgi:kinesin family protein 16B
VSREDNDLQEEHRKILQTIENALGQLNLERSKMHEQYKVKIKMFADELERLEMTKKDKLRLIDCKIEQLIATREMIIWEKSNEQTQVSTCDHI